MPFQAPVGMLGTEAYVDRWRRG